MKNTIALIIAIANQTLKGSPEIDFVKATFSARLETLSAAQDRLTQAAWSKATIGDLIEAALESHGAKHRFEVEGPSIELSSKCVLAMALATLELATNAAKYGALRNENTEFLLIGQSIGEIDALLPHRPFARLGRSMVIAGDRLREALYRDRDETQLNFEGHAEPIVIGRAATTMLRRARSSGPKL